MGRTLRQKANPRMASPPQPPSTLGSPVAKSLQPFSGNDLLSAFVGGAVWGGFALVLLGVGAWLVSVMRTRVMATATRAAIPQSTHAQHAAALLHHDEEALTSHVMPAH